MIFAPATATVPRWLDELFLSGVRPAARWRRSYGGTVNLANNELRHPLVESLIRRAVDKLDPRAWVGYPDYGQFRSRFAELLGIVEPSVFFTAGSDQSYRALFQLFGRDGRTVVTQVPNYSQLFEYASLLRMQVRSVPYRLDRGFDVEDMLEAIEDAEAGSIVAVSNPNGPTGHWWSPDQLLRVARVCLERRCLLVVDEAYAAYAPASALSTLYGQPHVVIVQSFSKAYGLAGARLAVNVCGDPRIADAVQAWNVSNPVSGPTLAVAAEMLTLADQFADVHAELIASRGAMNQGLRLFLDGVTVPGEGNFSAIRCRSIIDAERFADGVASKGFSIRRLDGFGLPDWVRVTAADHKTTTDFLDLARTVTEGWW
ncbi:aminotransferase class I/II-fold pyridoxal phosphate-dependent enzyme [Nocardia asiatica]|uniref:aminotransferase class I/II-fold pyridoxal phosphate-dependent enzyme n=1 Tax=Nocardia asiatica TaxID=209252 RepID=UPI0024581D47|nr:aminotransferase class I/II-fold pyridoxal phosphate-dependent enzyme [Nocardia asiatica]